MHEDQGACRVQQEVLGLYLIYNTECNTRRTCSHLVSIRTEQVQHIDYVFTIQQRLRSINVLNDYYFSCLCPCFYPPVPRTPPPSRPLFPALFLPPI